MSHTFTGKIKDMKIHTVIEHLTKRLKEDEDYYDS